MRPLFIGIGHKKQRGKDTFARMLRDALNWNQRGSCMSPDCVEMTSFADPLKVFCQMVFGLTSEQCYGTDEQKNSLTGITMADLGLGLPEFENHPLTARRVLQLFGTDVMREACPGIWAKAPMRRKRGPMVRYVIIPDTRFLDEVLAIKEAGGLVIRVDRPGVFDNDRHASENALNGYLGWDAVITNDGTLEDLGEQARNFADGLKARA